MSRQGSSTLSADEQGRILDRLAGLENIILPELVRQALTLTGRVNQRACPLSAEVTLWAILAMGLLTDLPIWQVFKAARRFRSSEKTPGRSALCEARKRLGVEPLACLHRLVVRPLATPRTPGATYKGYRWMGIDGTIFDVPDSEANAQAFGRANGGRGKGAFPQVRKVSLVELGTHVEVAMALGGWQDSEQELARQLWDQIPAGTLLTEDRGLFSFDAWKTLSERDDLRLLVRVKSQMVFPERTPLSDHSFLTWIYRNSHDRQRDRDGIRVRVIEYTINDPQRTGHEERHRLMTNLLDDKEYPALELIVGYHERWEVEVVFDEQKTHQDPRRAEKPAHLRSGTPDGVRQELYALSLGHYVVRAVMFAAAASADLDPDRLSFTGTIQILQCRLPECDARTRESLLEWLLRVQEEVLSGRLPARRNRINPRVIKRKMSKWNKKQPKHRRPPPLSKTFVETVVMAN